MKTLKYLWKCFMALMDTFFSSGGISLHPTLEIVGLMEIILIVAVFVVSTMMIAWYYALLITVGFVVVVCALIFLIEWVVNMFKKGNSK